MKKLLAVFVAALMLFGIFSGALAQTAKRSVTVSNKVTELAERRETVKAEKAEDKAPVVNAQPDVTKKVAVKDDEPDLNTALNMDGSTLVFTNDETYPWEVVTEGDRVYAMSGNTGVSSSTSSVTTTVTVPAVGVSRPTVSFMSVVLPEPLGPSSPTMRPAGISRFTPFNAGTFL